MRLSWRGLRASALVWLGIAGTAITLLGSLLSLGWVKVATIIADALHLWRLLTREAWALLVGWLGIDLAGPILPLLNFVVFALLMAIALAAPVSGVG